MILYQDYIRDLLDKGLNNNDEDFDFKVVLYNGDITPNNERLERVEGSYDVKGVKQIPLVIEEIAGDFENNEKVKYSEANAIITFLIPTTSEYIEDVLMQEITKKVFKQLDRFIKEYNANMSPLGEQGYMIFDDEDLLLTPKTANIEDEVTNLSFKIQSIEEHNDPVTIMQVGDTKLQQNKGELQFIKAADTIYTNSFEENEILDIDISDDTIYINDVEVYKYQSTIITDNEFKLYSFNGVWFEFSVDLVNDEAINITDFGNVDDTDFYSVTKSEGYGVSEWGSHGNLTWEFTQPTPMSNQFPYGDEGFQYQLFSWSIGLNISHDTYTGNNFKYFIDGERIYPTHANRGVSSEIDTDQMINSKTAKSVAETNAWGTDFTLYWTRHKNVRKLFKEIVSAKNREQNKIFNFEVHYPTHKEEEKVILGEMSYNSSPTTASSASFTLHIADDILEE